jgi:hypothetical protein
MNGSSTSAVGDETGALVLALSDPAHLFNAPRADPLSSSPAEVLGVSGVEYLLNLLHMDKKLQRARTLVLLLAPEKATSALAEQATLALHRQSKFRIEQQQRELRNTYRAGWRVTGAATLVLAVCLGLSSVFASDLTEGMRPLIRTTFEYGFEIIGWVILWHPIDMLVFAPLAFRARIAALQTLVSVNVVVRAEQAVT